MEFIDIPTERTTALTDFILGLLVVAIIIYLYRRLRGAGSLKGRIWLYTFGLLGFASFLGSFAHGFKMSKETNTLLWHPLNLSLGLVIAMFVCAVVYDLWGEAAYRKIQWPMIGVAVVFFLVTVIIPGTFLPFIIYETLAMLFALGGYLYLAIKGKLNGAWWMVAGILITIIAAAVQATGQNGVVIFWGLDHNGVFHFMQIFGVLALAMGLQTSLAQPVKELHPAHS